MAEFRIFEDIEACSRAIAEAFLIRIKQLLEQKDVLHVSITGGTLGILSLSAMATHPLISSMDWSRVHIWWGDERFVAVDSPDRNALQARSALLDLIPEAKIHEFPSAEAGLTAFEAAANFSKEVAKYSNQGHIPFDVILLGMGPDGHVASLFPGKPNIAGDLNVVAELDSPKPPQQRLTFTYDAINASDEVWLLVAGAEKAEPVAIANSENASSLPAGRVHGKVATLWFLDQAAASRLS